MWRTARSAARGARDGLTSPDFGVLARSNGELRGAIRVAWQCYRFGKRGRKERESRASYRRSAESIHARN
jgi:hypothetical protein